ncbi:MAG: hypothetical protein JXA92_10675 [candidate division Zixibacteria bacterium]|nr:hypothetical protein [candidate division Zixibacteria bacterium]
MVRLVSLIVPVIALFGGLIIWRLLYYNDFFPNTYYVKISSLDPVFLARGVFHLMKFFIYGGGFVYFIPLLIFGVLTWKKIETRAIFSLFVILSAFTIYTTGDWFPYGRFMQPILPMLIAGVAAGIVIIKEKLQLKKFALIIIIAFFLFSGYQNALQQNMEPTVDAFDHNSAVRLLSNLGQFFGEMQKEVPDMSIAAYPIGAIGYYSHARVIDMYGLTDYYIARNGVQLRGFVGHERTHTAYALEQKPDIVFVGANKKDSLGRLIPLFIELNPKVSTYDLPYSMEEIIESFIREYEYIDLPDYVGFWCRKDSPCMRYCI